MVFLRSQVFWLWFVVCAALFGAFFAWELGMLGNNLPRLPRVQPTQVEVLFTVALILLLAFNAGLYAWRRKTGVCPRGVKRATTAGGLVGAFALLCPVCLLLPASFFGAGVSLLFLAPFIPLLRIIAVLLLIASTMTLWPKREQHAT